MGTFPSRSMTIIEKVIAIIEQYAMLGASERVLVGLSGGPDSVCLLHILKQIQPTLGLDLAAMYVDHGLRPGEVEGEIAFCRDLCRSLDVHFTTATIDVSGSPLVRSLGKQGAARELRYAALENEAQRIGASKIALGHTKDDSAETLLINLLRGTGMSGLAGISPVRGKIIRPLIEIGKTEILRYLASHPLPYRTDSSNLTADYLRNRIRSHIIPELETINPSVSETLSRTAAILRQENEYLEVQVTKTFMRLISRKTPYRIELFLVPLETTPPVLLRRILRRAVAEVRGLGSLSHQHIEDILSLIRTGKSGDRIMLPKQVRVIRDYSVLILTTEKPGMLQTYRLDAGGEVYIEESQIVLTSSVSRLPCQGDGTRGPVFDLDKLTLPLIIRPRQKGDFFIPSGFGKKTKLQDFFVNSKVPRDMRDTVPLVCSGNNIIWVLGFRTDERFLPDNTTQTFLNLSVQTTKK